MISLQDLISANPKSVIDAKWIVYGNFLGDQKCSILRLIVAPGAKTTFRPECPTMFHTNGGSGRVGKLGMRYQQNMVLGEIDPEIGFITPVALANGGVEIENTGKEPLVLTFAFPQTAKCCFCLFAREQRFRLGLNPAYSEREKVEERPKPLCFSGVC